MVPSPVLSSVASTDWRVMLRRDALPSREVPGQNAASGAAGFSLFRTGDPAPNLCLLSLHASPPYTGIESRKGVRHYVLYDTVVSVDSAPAALG